jgi:hypothetical protein
MIVAILVGKAAAVGWREPIAHAVALVLLYSFLTHALRADAADGPRKRRSSLLPLFREE